MTRQNTHALAAAVLFLTFATACKPHIWTTAPPAVTVSPGKEGNLVYTGVDPNRAMTNPQWSAQANPGHPLPPIAAACNKEPYSSACTDFPVVKDSATGLNLIACSAFNGFPKLPGHADWVVAQYTGAIGWLNYAEDFDFNFMLFPENDAGITTNNHKALGIQKSGEEPDSTRYIEVEFDPRESVVNFSSAWWRELMTKATAFSQDSSHVPIMNEHEADRLPLGVVTGLFGLDCEHGCRSELHPVYALAIQTDDRASDNTWGIFARNWGNGGFCSRYDHQLTTANNQIKILLPRVSDTGPATIQPEDYEFRSTGQQPAAPRFEFIPGKGVLVTITLDGPAAHTQAELVVHLHWPETAAPAPYPELHYRDRTRVQSSIGTDHIETYLSGLRRRNTAPPPPPPPAPGRSPASTTPPKQEIPVPTVTTLAVPPPISSKGRLTVQKPGGKAEDNLLKDVCESFPPGQAPTDRIKDLNKICDKLRREKK